MSLKKTKAQLLRLLEDANNSVIALSGKWGTGKTHLWRNVVDEADNEPLKASLYASLFGLSTIDQLKRKLIESVIPGVEAHPAIWEGAKQAVAAGVKVLSGFHKGFETINDLNLLLLAPAMLGGKVIVIDDIERKHAKLGIDEVLGFIDEYTQRYKCRFVLILNSDQLTSDELWNTLREKVIDEEIRLSTTPAEAFAIAIASTPSRYGDAIKDASITCALINIRIIRKVIRAANRILGDRDLGATILARVIPSIVLFSAIHYKGLIDGPDFQFALGVGASDWKESAADRNGTPDEDSARRAKWRMLLHELGIAACDDFEAMVVEFLESGLFDDRKLAVIIDRYAVETQQMEARERANQLLFKEFWNHNVTEKQLLDEAATLPAIAGLLDPYMVTQLQQTLSKYPGGTKIGQEIVDQWIRAFAANPPQQVNDENPFHLPLHPAIKDEFAKINAGAQDRMTVVDACMTIIDQGGWGTMEELALRQATAAVFESAIRGMDIGKLQKFMRRMIEMSLQGQAYEKHFGTATKCFVEACSAIANDKDSPRLAALVKRLFEGTALAPQLERKGF